MVSLHRQVPDSVDRNGEARLQGADGKVEQQARHKKRSHSSLDGTQRGEDRMLDVISP